MKPERKKAKGRRTSIENIRRADLIEAALEVFFEQGLAGLTLTQIGERSGMSHGIIGYYFGTKDELIDLVVRRANCGIMQEVIRRLRKAQTPRERITAVIAGNFPPKVYNRDVARAWLSFYSAIGEKQNFARLQRAVYSRLRSNLLYDLCKLTDRSTAEHLVLEVGLTIDGLWVRQALGDSPIKAKEAVGIVEKQIAQALLIASHSQLANA